MKYIVEDLDDQTPNLIKSLKNYNKEVIETKFVPFKNTWDLVLDKPYSQYFPFCSVNTMQLAKEVGCKVYFTEHNYDYTKFISEYGNDFINSDAHLVSFSEFQNLNGTHYYRDAYGNNLIKGKVSNILPDIYKQYFGRTGHDKKIDDDYQMIIASPKSIAEEYRFFVVNEKILTASQYFLRGSLYIRNIDFTREERDDELFRFAYKMIYKYSPDDIFVIDIARMENGDLKVVECNCLHCSGFYGIDINRLVIGIIENF